MEKVTCTFCILKNKLESYYRHWVGLVVTFLCLYIPQIFYTFIFKIRKKTKTHRQSVTPAFTHHFVFWLFCSLPFLYCNLNFVLFLDPLLNLFTLCVQIMLSNI